LKWGGVCGRPTLLTYPLTPEARAFTLYVDSFVKDKARSAAIADVVSTSEDTCDGQSCRKVAGAADRLRFLQLRLALRACRDQALRVRLDIRSASVNKVSREMNLRLSWRPLAHSASKAQETVHRTAATRVTNKILAQQSPTVEQDAAPRLPFVECSTGRLLLVFIVAAASREGRHLEGNCELAYRSRHSQQSLTF
jgi:hypothetical protein